MLCGLSNRTRAALYGPEVYTEVSACTPTANTRALLVTRNGTISGNGPDWLAYLNSGGVIITEYYISDRVYNEIYGTAYSPGAIYGACLDAIAPHTKLNTSHPFWQINDITESIPGQESCGAEISAIVAAEPEVTALGQSSAGAVFFAIRPQGNGTLFLLDADWSDPDVGYVDNSRQMMNAMITYNGIVPAQQVTSVPSLSAVGLVILSVAMGLFGWAGRRRFAR